MKRWRGSCIAAILVLIISGSFLIFLVPFGGAMIAAMPPVFDRLTAYVLCPDATNYSCGDFGSVPIDSTNPSGGLAVLLFMILAAIIGAILVKPKQSES